MIKSKLYPKNGTLKRKLKFILNYAILAPSGHNSQPWTFVLTPNSIEVKPDFRYSRPASDPSNRELYISLGAVATNITIAANFFGEIFEKKYQVDPITKQQSILFCFKNGKTISTNQDLFKAILNRVTNRFELKNNSLDKNIIKYLLKCDFSNVKFTPIHSTSDKKELSFLVYESNILWFHKNEFVDELISWLRTDLSTQKDGLPPNTLIAYKTDIDIIKKAQREANMVMTSPLSVIISSSTESILNWINVDEAFQLLSLRLTNLGLVNGYFNSPVQLLTILKKLNQTFKLKSSAQLILRIGYPTQVAPRSPRRPLATFIVDMS